MGKPGEKRTMLRDALDDTGVIVAPGAYCALVGKLIADAGFPVVYVSGYATAAAIFGEPDVGTVTLSEMAESARRVAGAVDVPVICDADTGYGDVANVERTVRMFEESGIAAIHIQDKAWPVETADRRKSIVDTDTMTAKVRAAVAARTDPNFLIIARTDARSREDITRVIHRANAYHAAGADIIFVEEPESYEEVELLPKEVAAPLLINICEGYKTPMLRAKELEELGYKIVIFPITALLATVTRLRDLLQKLAASGDIGLAGGELVGESYVDEIVGMSRVESLYDAAFAVSAT